MTTLQTPPAANPAVPPAAEAPAPEQKKRATKPLYPGLKDAEGKRIQLTAIPGDYDSKVHRPLRAADFADEALFYDMMAARFQAKADHNRQRAEQIRALGSVEERQAATKLLKMQTQMQKLMKTLKDAGQDPQAILQAANAAAAS